MARVAVRLVALDADDVDEQELCSRARDAETIQSRRDRDRRLGDRPVRQDRAEDDGIQMVFHPPSPLGECRPTNADSGGKYYRDEKSLDKRAS